MENTPASENAASAPEGGSDSPLSLEELIADATQVVETALEGAEAIISGAGDIIPEDATAIINEAIAELEGVLGE